LRRIIPRLRGITALLGRIIARLGRIIARLRRIVTALLGRIIATLYGRIISLPVAAIGRIGCRRLIRRRCLTEILPSQAAGLNGVPLQFLIHTGVSHTDVGVDVQ
jgi:hypothetical protein